MGRSSGGQFAMSGTSSPLARYRRQSTCSFDITRFLLSADHPCESLIDPALFGVEISALSDHHPSLSSNFPRYPSAAHRRCELLAQSVLYHRPPRH